MSHYSMADIQLFINLEYIVFVSLSIARRIYEEDISVTVPAIR